MLHTGGSSLRRFGRHAPILLLLLLLAALGTRTFGVYLVNDDLKWMQRTIEDAPRPWNAFGRPLFGDYYRPIPHLYWLANYYVWGFNFEGHQAMYLLLWLAAVGLVYAVGRRLGGALAGFMAAATVGLNDIYLVVASWKSWYTTMNEFAVVMAWMLCYMRWLDRKERQDNGRGALAGVIVLGVVGVLSRELAPLVFSATVLVTWVLPQFFGADPAQRRRGRVALALWAAATLAVLAALPSYRSSALALFASGATATGSVAEGTVEATKPSAGNLWPRFQSHAESILQHGISRYLLFFAALSVLVRRWRIRAGAAAAERERRVLMGAFIIGTLVAGALALLVAIAIAIGALKSGVTPESVPIWAEMKHLVPAWLLPASAAMLFPFVFLSAMLGDKWDRALGAWFAVTFLPVLFLEHGSNAYHLLAFAALALFAAREMAVRIREEVLPAWARLRGRLPPGRQDDARLTLAVIVAILLATQACILVLNPIGVEPQIRSRVARGRDRRQAVDRTVAAMSAKAEARRAVVGREPYSELAGWILREEHGFALEELERPGLQRVGLRRFDVPLRVYTHAVEYTDAQFGSCNALPDRGFEAAEGRTVCSESRSGSQALCLTADAHGAHGGQLDSPPFGLRPGAFVFGGFVRIDAQTTGPVRMALVAEDLGGYQRRTPPALQRAPEWELVWECAAPAFAGEAPERYVLRILESAPFSGGRIMVDDAFFCPVEALLAE